ncbi:MAG: M48 family metalloprotease [Helicobacteraceae bacterium]|jgi:Zn-dependent protease with chaperone function|nr:M48 family metalloprotease [Helicobacteraceae bacterium]
MNFREEQRLAKRNSRRLFASFWLGAAFIFLIWCYLVFATIYNIPIEAFFDISGQLGTDSAFEAFMGFIVILPLVLAPPFYIWLSVIYTKRKIDGHGSLIAKALGARAASPVNPTEKRLLNIVKEIALASGVLTPRVYILNNDESINTLTAGDSPQKAAIVVTSGALRYLNRDELQGVIAHEFSHISNEDMKFNMQMILLILSIEVTGNTIDLNSAQSAIYDSHKTNNDSNAFSIMLKERMRFLLFMTVICFPLGGMEYIQFMLLIAFLIFAPMVGIIFASAIKAAINKQREFLADASAVQFCRHNGIASALKKIGGSGSIVKNLRVSAFSHLFFAQAIKSRLFATHPPLAERIKRVDPKWDGRFIISEALNNYDVLSAKSSDRDKTKIIPTATIAMATASAAIVAAGKNVIKPKEPNATSEVSNLAANASEIDLLSIATADIEAVPEYLREQAADALAARRIIYALLIDRVDRAVAARQHKIVATRVYPDGFEKIIAAIDSLKRESVVHLIFLCVPALKNLTIDQYKRFREVADLLIEEDGKVSLFEFNLKYLVFYPLDIAFDVRKPLKMIYFKFDQLAKEISVALSAIVYDQYQNDEKAEIAFHKVCGNIRGLAYIPSEQILASTLENAYNQIQRSAINIKLQIINMAIESVKSDGAISPEEAETIHALRSALGLGYM